ncbi:MAG: hypothetical protein ACOZDY_13500 [Pseudomonadota bacterium]
MRRPSRVVAAALLAAGARTELVAKDGWTAEAAAEMAGYTDIAALVRKAK